VRGVVCDLRGLAALRGSVSPPQSVDRNTKVQGSSSIVSGRAAAEAGVLDPQWISVVPGVWAGGAGRGDEG
jgi:hypothetical protein